MKQYRIEAEAAVEFDVESAFEWYETETPDLDLSFWNSFAQPIDEFSKIRLDIKSYVPAFAAL